MQEVNPLGHRTTDHEALAGEQAMEECVLVPIDLSSDADRALQYALALGVASQTHIVLLHVRDDTAWNPWAYSAGAEAATRNLLEHKLQEVFRAGLSGEVILAHGVPWKEIIDCVQRLHVNLIVMGSHGRTGLYRFLLGSVVEQVLRHAPCAVLVTRHPDTLHVPD
jgi:nucleotide-binding universal stress UspA family protein